MMADRQSRNGLGGKNMSELVRANRISVMAEDCGFVATFYRTHKKLGTVESRETSWLPMEGLNNTAQRELFRVHVIQHCEEYGYQYDAQDRRTEDNQLPRTYGSDEILIDTAIKLVTKDIEEWVGKINADLIDKANIGTFGISCEGVDGVSLTKNGKEVKPKYGNGNWAWAEIALSVTLDWTINGVSTEVYVDMTAELVSGQLKKPTMIGQGGYNYTNFKAEAMVDITDQLPIEDKTKKEAEPKVEEAIKKDEPISDEQPTKTKAKVIKIEDNEVPVKPKRKYTRKAK